MLLTCVDFGDFLLETQFPWVGVSEESSSCVDDQLGRPSSRPVLEVSALGSAEDVNPELVDAIWQILNKDMMLSSGSVIK